MRVMKFFFFFLLAYHSALLHLVERRVLAGLPFICLCGAEALMQLHTDEPPTACQDSPDAANRPAAIQWSRHVVGLFCLGGVVIIWVGSSILTQVYDREDVVGVVCASTNALLQMYHWYTACLEEHNLF